MIVYNALTDTRPSRPGALWPRDAGTRPAMGAAGAVGGVDADVVVGAVASRSGSWCRRSSWVEGAALPFDAASRRGPVTRGRADLAGEAALRACVALSMLVQPVALDLTFDAYCARSTRCLARVAQDALF